MRESSSPGVRASEDIIQPDFAYALLTSVAAGVAVWVGAIMLLVAAY